MSEARPDGGRPALPWGAQVALLAAMGLALLLPGLGAPPLERAEVYFVDAARAMVERRDYVVPYYRGEPFFDKPALTYWLMAASFRALGFTITAARLVPAIAAVLVILVTVWLGRMLFDRAAALLGGLVLATTAAFMAFGRIAMSDMLLTLWSTLAVALAVKACAQGRSWPWIPVAGAALGVGFLTKGPVAVLLPGLGILAVSRSKATGRLPLGAGAVAAAAAAFALLGLGWFALVWARLGSEPLSYFFLRENLERFAGETYDTGREPWYYVLTYLAMGLPWSFLLPPAAWAAARATGEDGRHRRGARLLLAWVALMAVPLSLSRGKIDYYLLPLYPALALVIGAHLARGWRTAGDRLWARLALVACAALLALLPVAGGRFPDEWLPRFPVRVALVLLSAGCALACAWAAIRARPRAVVATLAAVSAAAFLAGASVVLPAFAAAQPHDAVVADVRRERVYRPDMAVVACQDEARLHREVLFHARVAVRHQCDVWAPATSRQPYLLLLRAPERASLAHLEGLREIASYRYVPGTALTLRGLLAGPQASELTLVANYATTDPVAETKRKRDRKRALRALAQAGGS